MLTTQMAGSDLSRDGWFKLLGRLGFVVLRFLLYYEENTYPPCEVRAIVGHRFLSQVYFWRTCQDASVSNRWRAFAQTSHGKYFFSPVQSEGRMCELNCLQRTLSFKIDPSLCIFYAILCDKCCV